ncbi:MAG: PEP-CTERM sorting domain-containing protein [Verrucomicrobiia bacterium]
MKPRLFLLPFICLTLLTLSTTWSDGQNVITFDDLHVTGSGEYIPNGYQGLVWSNFGVVNAILETNLPLVLGGGVSGIDYGMVSPSNVAVNAGGTPAEIDSATNFNFLSVYLTGAWSSNLNIEVQGFNNGTLLYDTTVTASATNPTLFTFNYLDIDRLYFNSFGGQNAGFSGSGENFVMDNMTFAFIPEPSSFLLAALGAVSLVAFLRRRRV